MSEQAVTTNMKDNMEYSFKTILSQELQRTHHLTFVLRQARRTFSLRVKMILLAKQGRLERRLQVVKVSIKFPKVLEIEHHPMTLETMQVLPKLSHLLLTQRSKTSGTDMQRLYQIKVK